MPQSWNDGRLDDLNIKVNQIAERMDSGFERVDKRFDAMNTRFDAELRTQREDMKSGFDRVVAELRTQRQEMKAGFDDVNTRFEAMHRLMAQAAVGFATAFVAGSGALASLIVTQT